jgi:hypothetical protein
MDMSVHKPWHQRTTATVDNFGPTRLQVLTDFLDQIAFDQNISGDEFSVRAVKDVDIGEQYLRRLGILSSRRKSHENHA